MGVSTDSAGSQRPKQTKLRRPTAARPRGGRQLTPEHSATILEAATAILVESGFAGLTMDAVAERAGVGKPAIYRRWANKEALIEEAVLRVADDSVPFTDTGSLREDAIASLTKLERSFQDTEGRVMVALAAEAARDPEWGPVVVHIQHRRRERSRVIVDRAIARGELPPDVDANLLLDLLGGPFWVHALIWRDIGTDPSLVERVVDRVLAAFTG